MCLLLQKHRFFIVAKHSVHKVKSPSVLISWLILIHTSLIFIKYDNLYKGGVTYLDKGQTEGFAIIN